mmetsp:Transcript_39385/g.79531  ORF Transcript_39385/g.79531 Transcript_39385/m.79531 type:complete len:87 (-) Transcript_39385:12-272(-)
MIQKTLIVLMSLSLSLKKKEKKEKNQATKKMTKKVFAVLSFMTKITNMLGNTPLFVPCYVKHEEKYYKDEEDDEAMLLLRRTFSNR